MSANLDEVRLDLQAALMGDTAATHRLAARLAGPQAPDAATAAHQFAVAATNFMRDPDYQDCVHDPDLYAATVKLDSILAQQMPQLEPARRLRAAADDARRRLGGVGELCARDGMAQIMAARRHVKLEDTETVAASAPDEEELDRREAIAQIAAAKHGHLIEQPEDTEEE